MQNIHQLFQSAFKPFSPPAMRPYSVTIRAEKRFEEVRIVATSSSDAFSRALAVMFDGDEQVPDNLTVEVAPISFPRAA